MRMIMVCVALVALVAAGAAAQDAVTQAKDSITDTKIIDMCGGRLAKMFTQFGTPAELIAIRGKTSDKDYVLCDYGTYFFHVRKKVILACFFWSDWKGPIRGIKIGDSREDVVKVLGNAQITVKDKNGVVTAYGYRMKDLDVEFYTDFDKDGKVREVEIGPLD
jgi:hypothetical protein